MKLDFTKWVVIGLSGLIGVSHISMIGLLGTRKEPIAQSKWPLINLPAGDYTSYEVEAGTEGYAIKYQANDPKIMEVSKDIVRKGGFLGAQTETTKVYEQYTMDGSRHHGGPVSTRSAWIDPSALSEDGSSQKAVSDKTIECIKAQGGASQSGRLVGSSVGASLAPSVSGIPFVGWLASGWVTMFGGNQGAKIGEGMATRMSEACIEEVEEIDEVL